MILRPVGAKRAAKAASRSWSRSPVVSSAPVAKTMAKAPKISEARVSQSMPASTSAPARIAPRGVIQVLRGATNAILAGFFSCFL